MRLFGVDGLASFPCAEGPIGLLAAKTPGSVAGPVRAILFDKTPRQRGVGLATGSHGYGAGTSDASTLRPLTPVAHPKK
jgi:hypothetical protein